MRRFKIVSVVALLCVLMRLPASGQSTCSDYDSPTPIPVGIVVADGAQHSTGSHGFTGTATFACTYTSGGTTFCNTKCTITTSINSRDENGTLNDNAFFHKVNAGAVASPNPVTNRGTSCNATFGGAAIRCPQGTSCDLLLSVDPITGEIPTVSGTGELIWRDHKFVPDVPFVCPEKPDPETASGGGFTGCAGGGRVRPECPSPIIVDTRGEGVRLTSAADGVGFDIRADGHPIQIAWTATGSGNGFLALDRNHNGTIDDGSELFGNFTAQPKSPTPNGFLALAEFDKTENGGNGDGIIDEHDAVYSHLVIWIDENHDGISQPAELHTLPELGIYSLSLQYKESRRTDEFGNLFRYRAKANPGPNDGASDAGRWAVDVFLTTTPK